MEFFFLLIFDSTGNYLLLLFELPENRVPVLILDVNNRMTVRYWNALALESYERVMFRIDQLVFEGVPDDGVEIHLQNGNFVFDNGELVFGEEEDETDADDVDDAPAAASEVNTGNGAQQRTEVLYDTVEQRDLPLGHHPFSEFQRVVTQLKGSPR